jgi:nucleoside-diphosphate-sugar epimerase
LKVLVTGGGGFLGGAVIGKFIEAGNEVTSFSRSEHTRVKELGAEFFRGDLRDPEHVHEAVNGMDAVVHTAAMVGYWGKYDDFYDVNVNGTKNIVHACRKNGINNLVYTSSPSVIFDGKDMKGKDETIPYPAKYDSFYSKTKAIAERYVLSSNDTELRTISLRPHLIWGPGDTHIIPGLIERVKQGKMIRVGNGKNIADMVYVDNAADAHVLGLGALEENPNSRGRPYFITNGEPRNVWDFIEDILKAAGLGPIKRSVPAGPALAYGALLETYYRIFKKREEPPLSRFLVKELITSHWYDISAARKELKYEPKVSMDEGLKRLKEWFDRNPP